MGFIKLFRILFAEQKIFYSVLAFNIALLLCVKFYPSMDGPSHLYNSNLIGHLIKGDSFVIGDYFTLNRAIIPNWMSHFVLSLFNMFLPAWFAEKVLLILYLIGISISFRLLIKQLCKGDIPLAISISPFAYSFLFHLGFYNYCLSFIFLFLTLYYWIKHHQENNYSKYIILFILLWITYFSAILTFFFLGFCLGLFTIIYSFKNYTGSKASSIFKKISRELILLLIISLPCLIFALIFINSITFPQSKEHLPTAELVKWLSDVRCLIVYDYIEEEKLTKQFLHIAIAIVSISFFVRLYKIKPSVKKSFFRIGDVFIVPTLLALLLLFTVPNSAHAGMMSDRYCMMAFMFFILWVASQTLPKSVSYFFMVLIITLHISLLLKRHGGTIKNLNEDAVAINNASKYIKQNSVVLPVNMSDHWIQPHFSNYLGIDKPLIILENYEAFTGWFPVVWNTRNIPRLKLGEFDEITGSKWISNIASSQIKQIDYVFLYGNLKSLNTPEWSDLKEALNKCYKLIFSDNNFINIYTVR